MAIGTLHFSEELAYKSNKALIAAKYNGLKVETRKFDFQKDSEDPVFLSKNPTGKVPFLETEMGCIFTSNAVARYVSRCRSDTGIYGRTFDDEGQIDTWVEFSTHEIEIPLMTWTYPVMGLMEDTPAATEAAKGDVKKALAVLEDRLKSSKYLIGDSVSLADIVLVCSLWEGFTRVFDPSFRKPFTKTCAWFEGCCGLPQFRAILGDLKLCSTAAKPQAVKKAIVTKTAAPPKTTAPVAVSTSVPSGDVDKQIQEVGDQIRILKEKLKADGVTGKKMNENPQVVELVAKLKDLKSGAPVEAPPPVAAAAAAPAPAAAPAATAAPAGDVESVGNQIRELKEKLKAEGKSGKEINNDAEVKRLVSELQELKKVVPAGSATAATAPAPAPVVAPPVQDSGDTQAQITAVGDQIRTLKEKLKADGLSGKKVNEHEEVKALVAKLQELKAKAS